MIRRLPPCALACAIVLSCCLGAHAQQDNDGDGFTVEEGDCDDCDAEVHPGADEYCNGIDDDCDQLVDEDFDLDGDGLVDCVDDDEDGYTEEEGDCDDQDAGVSPAVHEACNGVDDDCDGEIDQGMDGFAASIPVDGTSDCIDDDGDGYTEVQGDCDDLSPMVHPGARELCLDGVDNDCNHEIDYDDQECEDRAEEASGIVCHCDYPDPPEAGASRRARLAWTVAGLSLLVTVRRRAQP